MVNAMSFRLFLHGSLKLWREHENASHPVLLNVVYCLFIYCSMRMTGLRQ